VKAAKRIRREGRKNAKAAKGILREGRQEDPKEEPPGRVGKKRRGGDGAISLILLNQ